MGMEHEYKRRLEEIKKLTDCPEGLSAVVAVRQLVHDLKTARDERDQWKRRAAKHGCNVDDGDPDCG